MAQIGISDPTVRVNNDTFNVVPNSITYVAGYGENIVKVQSAGNGQVETVMYENVESKKSSFKCSVFVTVENIDKLESLKDNKSNNFVSASQGSWSKVFNNMTLINDPEISLSSEGETELEFEGSPAR